MGVKYPNYVNLTSSGEEQPNERTPSPPQAPSKSISIKSTHYTSSSSPSESTTPTHVAPPPKLRFVIPIKLEPQELPPPQISPNDPYVQTINNWPLGPSNPSPPLRVSRPPLGFLNPPPEFEPLSSTQPFYYSLTKWEQQVVSEPQDGPFQLKTAKGDAKSESQWTANERRMVVQDQRLESIIMSCLPDDIMETVISYVSVKETWTDLIHSFEGPSDTKENRIMDLKLKYQTFRTKSTESLSQTYTRYKTLLNELANDGFNLSKHEINVGFVNSLPKKWLNFSQGLRNANHTQTLDLADIYERFVNEDNLIQRRRNEEHEEHLRQLSELLKNKELYTKFSKCEFWLPKVQFLDHIVDSQGIHVHTAKIESIKD
uniref:Putative reverse transcriptase domain-containing protein n=1 Tax=Tanacetum cinerariifolium TaxID=118510 RepID=A0A6L2N676_TANCI|nr:putative reverse transcriptase domain-containing protein [Tanacetum cinerariifolium]